MCLLSFNINCYHLFIEGLFCTLICYFHQRQYSWIVQGHYILEKIYSSDMLLLRNSKVHIFISKFLYWETKIKLRHIQSEQPYVMKSTSPRLIRHLLLTSSPLSVLCGLLQWEWWRCLFRKWSLEPHSSIVLIQERHNRLYSCHASLATADLAKFDWIICQNHCARHWWFPKNETCSSKPWDVSGRMRGHWIVTWWITLNLGKLCRQLG